MVTNNVVDVSLYPEFKKTLLSIIDECDSIMEIDNSTAAWKAGQLQRIFTNYGIL